MKFLIRRLPLLVLAVSLGAGTHLRQKRTNGSNSKARYRPSTPQPRPLPFARGHKDFVFQIDIERCNIVKDGHYPLMAGAQSPALQSAQIGDSVVGKLVVEGSTPVVTRLYLTSKPEPGVRVKEKPGFVTSPTAHFGWKRRD